MELSSERLLSRDFFLRDPTICAQELLGKVLVRYDGNEILSGRIVETEAYHQFDPASHSYRGKTKRCATMFEEGGKAYVYMIYGMYYCLNVVTEPKGVGSAVLIRAIEPLQGLEKMKERRTNDKDLKLTNGPGKLCRALNIKKDSDGVDLLSGDIKIYQDSHFKCDIVQTTRIGIREKETKLFRFYIKDNPYVSVR